MREILSVVTNQRKNETSPAIDDRSLAAAAAAGDEEAFGRLVRKYSGGLHRTVARMLHDETEAWDVVQMALLKSWQQIKRYNPKWSFATWLYRIGTNVAIDVIRARKSRNNAHERGMEHRLRVIGEQHPSSERAVGRDVEKVLANILPSLSPHQQAAFVLREIEGMDTSEVSKILGCSTTTVRNHIFQARKILRVEIAARYPEYLPASRRKQNEVQ